VFTVMAVLPAGGWGDAKLGLFTGLALGLDLVVPAIFVTAIAGGLGALAVLAVFGWKARGRAIPYGPYIALGAAVVMLSTGTAFVRV
jgi:prepilin signal peptidase PulO-like enzyme (type II secretory pathway)